MSCWQKDVQLEITKNRIMPCCHTKGIPYDRNMSLKDLFALSKKTDYDCSNCAWSIGRIKLCDGGTIPTMPSDLLTPKYSEWAFLNGDNTMFHENLKTLEYPILTSLQMDTTCNRTCLECNQRHDDTTTISFPILEDILRNHDKIARLYVTGGEPFYSTLTLAFLRECIGKHFYMIFSTNGLVIDFPTIEKLSVLRMQLSIWTTENYNYWHGEGSYALILKNMQRLASLRKRTGNPHTLSTNVVLFKGNAEEARAAIERDLRFGFQTWFSLGQTDKEDMKLTKDELPYLQEAMKIAKYPITKTTLGAIIENLD